MLVLNAMTVIGVFNVFFIGVPIRIIDFWDYQSALGGFLIRRIDWQFPFCSWNKNKSITGAFNIVYIPELSVIAN